MLSFNVNGREIRSFRLRFLTNKFYSFFMNKDSTGLFMSCALVQPEERILLRSDFSKNNIEYIYIGKNISRFLFSSKKTIHIKNLLQGGVVLIRDRLNNSLSIEKIKFLLTQKKFYFRFFFSNLFFYRYNKIRMYFNFVIKRKEDSFFFVTTFFLFKLNLNVQFIVKFLKLENA